MTYRYEWFISGVYLTKLSPALATKRTIASNNYTTQLGNYKMLEGKVDTCIELLLKDTDVTNVSEDGRNIYLYRGDLKLSGANLKTCYKL